jgi:predicted RNA-binding protein
MAKWIVTTSEDNLAKILEHQIIGVPLKSGSALSKIKKGDRIVIYIGKRRHGYGGLGASVSEFVATGEVMDDEPFFSEELIWHSRSGERFPWRRKVRIVPNKRVKAKGLIDLLSFIHKKDKWGAYFLTTLREITDADYAFISKAIGGESR